MNTAKMLAARRQKTTNAVLTEVEVARIKKNLMEGISPRECAGAYSVGVETIRRIGRGETWEWVEAEGQETLAPMTPELERAAAASQERLQKMLEQGGEQAPADPVTRIIEEANQFLNPAGLDKFIGEGK